MFPRIKTFGQQLLKRIVSLILDSDTEPVEAICKVTLLIAGIQLTLPYNTFASVSSYAVIAKLISNEEVAGILVSIVALIGLAGFVFKITALRLYGAGIGSLIFGAFALGIFEVTPLSIGVIAYSVLAIAEIWVTFRRSVEGGDG